MNDQKIEVSVGLLNGVLAYLVRRPYDEVFQLIQAIQEQAAQSTASQTQQPPAE